MVHDVCFFIAGFLSYPNIKDNLWLSFTSSPKDNYILVLGDQNPLAFISGSNASAPDLCGPLCSCPTNGSFQ